jgi:hypothetical protein
MQPGNLRVKLVHHVATRCLDPQQLALLDDFISVTLVPKTRKACAAGTSGGWIHRDASVTEGPE